MINAASILGLLGRAGTFVEAGAHDGVGDSETYALEQQGWAGLCVEPSSAFTGLKQSRKCRVDNRCLWKHDGEVTFRELAGEYVELSGVTEAFGDHWDRSTPPHTERKHPCATLTTVLQQHFMPRTIDYLSLDTEGSELEILRAHDFSKYMFLVMLIELNNVATRRAALNGLLLPMNYALAADDGQNLLYVHRSAPI